MKQTITLTGLELRRIIKNQLNINKDELDIQLWINIPYIDDVRGGQLQTDISKKSFTIEVNL